MKSRSRRRWCAFTTTLALGVGVGNAFQVEVILPSTAGGIFEFQASGIHEGIVDDALEAPFGPASFSWRAKMNVKLEVQMTDSREMGVDHVHFDAESFARGQMRLRGGRGAVVNYARRGQFEEARFLLGSMLHTVHDFYAHSTWVESGRTGLAPLGREGEDFSTNHSFSACNDSGLIGSGNLTSGWAPTENVIAGSESYAFLHPSGFSKCLHGRSFGPLNPVMLQNWMQIGNSDFRGAGLNKDGPMRTGFGTARHLAVQATRQYIEDIMSDLEDEPDARCGLMDQPAQLCAPLPPPNNNIIVPVRTDARVIATRLCTLLLPDCPPAVVGDSQTFTSTTPTGHLHATVLGAEGRIDYTVTVAHDRNTFDDGGWTDIGSLEVEVDVTMGGIGFPIGPLINLPTGPVRHYPYTEAEASLLSEFIITIPHTPGQDHQMSEGSVVTVRDSNFQLGPIFDANEPGATEGRCRPLGHLGPLLTKPGLATILGGPGGMSDIEPGTYNLVVHPEAYLRLRSGQNDVTPPRFGSCSFTARFVMNIYVHHPAPRN